MNRFIPGHTLTLRDARRVQFIAMHPDDGACLVGEELDREDGETGHFVTFERDQIVEINGRPRTPADRDRLNFLMPVIHGPEGIGDARALLLAGGLATGKVGNDLIDWAISRSPDFRF